MTGWKETWLLFLWLGCLFGAIGYCTTEKPNLRHGVADDPNRLVMEITNEIPPF
jgi:hypothetical protein